MVKTSKQDATGSAVGFYYQALFAILLLLDADDGGIVSVETGDDVQSGVNYPRLYQLKHAQGTPPALTEKNDGFWNSLGIWIPKLGDAQTTFVFVTCARIAPKCALEGLTSNAGAFSHDDVVETLDAEAKRVAAEVAAVKAAKPAGELPYSVRRRPCEDFLALAPADKLALVKRITLLPLSPAAKAVEGEVQGRLVSHPKGMRQKLARDLLEWWDYRVTRSLLGTAAREITKDELLNKVFEITMTLADDNLPDNFGLAEPVSLAGELDSTMEMQIALVNGGASRVRRAAIARWRAREQRARWILDRVGFATALDEFDEGLKQAWASRHGPMCDDCATVTSGEKEQEGRKLLDWAHLEAHLELPRLRPKFDRPFVVQGSFQELAERLLVGWHPDYMSLIQASKKTGGGSK